MQLLDNLKEKARRTSGSESGEAARGRRALICADLFKNRKRTLFTLDVYKIYLNKFFEFTSIFQSKEPKLHLLLAEMKHLIHYLCCAFLGPSAFVDGDLPKISALSDKAFWLPLYKVLQDIPTHDALTFRQADQIVLEEIKLKARKGFALSAAHLLGKLPL